MKKELGESITKSDIRFAVFIFGVIITPIILFVKLQFQVNAIDSYTKDKGSIMRNDLNRQELLDDQRHKILIEVRDAVIRMEKDVEFIKREIDK